MKANVIRRNDGQPFFPGTVNDRVYVLKPTDRWLPVHGLLWSGAHGRVKTNQHASRAIVDSRGHVLRGPLS